ncbi:hypothetical protein [Marinospirillum insulare]|uniref:Uncharacterized protein n=1 Tax=Marinospirillum insulare TaxID=217169 RepID=A0ABQ5ZZ37_9GAMM|nr:hypothetical protein [Marinospirillum insulare]GLR63931.1 hypothetical protein GCM10007878_13690 [Marinospirillum insulare]
MCVDTYSQKRLFAAILNQGFLDLKSTKSKLRNDAEVFLSSKYAYKYAEILGIDGEVLQRGVQKHLKNTKRNNVELLNPIKQLIEENQYLLDFGELKCG